MSISTSYIAVAPSCPLSPMTMYRTSMCNTILSFFTVRIKASFPTKKFFMRNFSCPWSLTRTTRLGAYTPFWPIIPRTVYWTFIYKTNLSICFSMVTLMSSPGFDPRWISTAFGTTAPRSPCCPWTIITKSIGICKAILKIIF